MGLADVSPARGHATRDFATLATFPPEAARSQVEALCARWDTYLGSLRTHAGELFTRAHRGCMEAFEAQGRRPEAFECLLPTLRNRLLALQARAEDAWQTSVEGAALSAGLRWEDGSLEIQHAKILRLGLDLDLALEAFEIRLHADAARRLWECLEELEAPDVCCGHCGAPLPGEAPGSSVPCSACLTTTTAQRPLSPSLRTYLIPRMAMEAAWEKAHQFPPRPRPQALVDTAAFCEAEAAWRQCFRNATSRSAQ